MSITLKEVSFTYQTGPQQQIQAVQDISFHIQDGAFVGIMGQTGCGKTTLMQLMAGLLTPTTGQVLVDGEDINSEKYDRETFRKKIGVVFQYPEYQLFETTVERDVAFGLKYSGLSKEEKETRVKEALNLMGFSFGQIKDQSPLALSGGEKRRVAIAGVLVAKPKILIFDEPVAGLDGLGCVHFMELVKKLNESGITIVMISHDADILCEYAGEILVLKDGRLALEGTPKEVFADTKKSRELGIGVSQPKRIAELLLKRGIPIPDNPVCYEELLEALKKYYERR